jgi:hypothetical protein
VSRLPRQRAPPRSLRGKQKSVPLLLFESPALSKNVGVHLSLGADILPGSTASGIDPKKCILIVARVIATRVCVAGLGLRYSTIATSAQWRRYGANRVPISSSFTSAASAFDSDVAGKAVPLRPCSRLLSGRLPQLGTLCDVRARRAVHLRPRDRRVGAPYCSVFAQLGSCDFLHRARSGSGARRGLVKRGRCRSMEGDVAFLLAPSEAMPR